jgi:antitoxin ChpS
LDELLAQCDPNAPRSKEEQEWFDSKPVGGELI